MSKHTPSKTIWERCREWAAFVMSAVAFIASMVMVYFNFVRQDDNLSIIFREIPLLLREDGESLTSEWSDLSVILINNGNRPAVVSKVSIGIYEHEGPTDETCDYNGSQVTTFNTDFEPVVLKEKEVTFKKIAIRGTMMSRTLNAKKISEQNYRSPILEKNKGKEKIPVETCLEVHLSTPALADYRVRIALDYLEVDREYVSLGRYTAEPPRPHKLLRDIRTIFQSY